MSEDSKNTQAKRIALAGASGTIGRAVAAALARDGHEVVALIREGSEVPEQLADVETRPISLSDQSALADMFAQKRIETVISCIASRSGTAKDAERVDFLANLALLKAAETAGAEHFILLSAICVQKPLLAFQHAKIAFERALKASPIDHTIVRPTAFFKSLSGQVERVRAGKPFLLFGDGELTRCKPISDRDLARFIADCVVLADRKGQELPIGGPGPAISPREQGEILFAAAGMEPRYRSVPVAMFSAAAGVLSLGARFSDWFAQKAEYARIGRYYATESMLVLDPATQQYSDAATPEFGSDTLPEHYLALLEKPA